MIQTTPEGEEALGPLFETFRRRNDRWGTVCPSFLPPDSPRGLGHRIAEALLAWALLGEGRWTSERSAALVRSLAERLAALQHADGTVDSDNLHSPPDTAFVLETLESVLRIAEKAGVPPDLAQALGPVRDFCDRGARMLVTAGIHTPNHRWLVAGVLADAWRRTGEAAYRDRALEWLAEGIDLDADGQYSERSTGIYTAVTNHSLIRAAEGLGLPGLLEPVRRSLDTLLLLLQPNGELETVASRRQDQAMVFDTDRHFFPFWYMACRDQNPRYAAVARMAARTGDEPAWQLPDVAAFEAPGGLWNLPRAGTLPDRFTTVLGASGLVRHRAGDLAVSVYGGTDLGRSPDYPDLSGIATNPTLVTLRFGQAVCRWLRIRPRFFDLTSIRPRLESFDGRRAVLVWDREVPYFQPLPAGHRNPTGDYRLSTGDRRFWSCLDFDARPRSDSCRLGFRVTVDLTDTGCEVAVEAEASAATSFSLELAFDDDQNLGADGGLVRCGRGPDSFTVTAPGPWQEVTDLPPAEPGRHSGLKGGETRPRGLVRYALGLPAPGRATLTFKTDRPTTGGTHG